MYKEFWSENVVTILKDLGAENVPQPLGTALQCQMHFA